MAETELKKEKAIQKMQEVKSKPSIPFTGKIEVVYYTDPLCCWSWAFEQHWRRLLNEFKGKITWRYCMGGLIPDWKNYNDVVNSVTRPVQMGPVWMHAASVAGVPIYHQLWIEDAPASSYPACIAFKCAELQSAGAGDYFLVALRKACMLHGKNIAKKEVLLKVADDIAKESPDLLDITRFKKDFKNGSGLEAFRSDLQQTTYHRINRFPSLLIRKHDQPAMLLSGYIPYEVLANSVKS